MKTRLLLFLSLVIFGITDASANMGLAVEAFRTIPARILRSATSNSTLAISFENAIIAGIEDFCVNSQGYIIGAMMAEEFVPLKDILPSIDFPISNENAIKVEVLDLLPNDEGGNSTFQFLPYPGSFVSPFPKHHNVIAYLEDDVLNADKKITGLKFSREIPSDTMQALASAESAHQLSSAHTGKPSYAPGKLLKMMGGFHLLISGEWYWVNENHNFGQTATLEKLSRTPSKIITPYERMYSTEFIQQAEDWGCEIKWNDANFYGLDFAIQETNVAGNIPIEVKAALDNLFKNRNYHYEGP